MVAMLVVMSLFISSCLTHRSEKDFEENSMKKPFDAIIVPGYPFEGKEWSDVMKMRVLWSKYLFENDIAHNIIYSGSAVYTPYVESEIMKLYAIELGIPEENILTEDKAEHSTENIYYSYHLAKEKGFDKIALASDPFQTAMLKSFAKKKKLNVDYLPIVYDKLEGMDEPNPEINPSTAFIKNFESLTERENFFKRWRGTLGKNLDEKGSSY